MTEEFLGPKHFIDAPKRSWNLAEALRYTRWLATAHYENFHVVSFLLPKHLHQDFYNVYAYCRWADDLGDEIGDLARSTELLHWWRAELERMYQGEAEHPVFVALKETVARYAIPEKPFTDLITAFLHDQVVTRYANWDEVFAYCVNSANPVGRLVLYLCGFSDDARQKLSDATCTGLQLANFWQDVAVDLEKNRIYLPLDLLARHGVTEQDLFDHRATPGFRAAMREAVAKARECFAQGRALPSLVDKRLALDLELFTQGGLYILTKIEKQDCDVLRARPENFEVRTCRSASGNNRARSVQREPGGLTVAESYAYCRGVARSRAKNFYYSFILLSRDQKNAMCAVYAFMRYCDDLSDEPGASKSAIEQWRGELSNALEGRFGAHPVWPAFHDTVQRFQIPHQYFYDMIEGVASDLAPTPIDTFDDLYRYCYKGRVGGRHDHGVHLRLRFTARVGTC